MTAIQKIDLTADQRIEVDGLRAKAAKTNFVTLRAGYERTAFCIEHGISLQRYVELKRQRLI
jgi:hypothetical protein